MLARLSRLLVLFAVFLAVATLPSKAQLSSLTPTTAPIFGGTAGLPAPPANPFVLPGANFIPIHKGPSGVPCIRVTGISRPQTVNPHIIEQMVTAVNSCPKMIKLQVCYFKSKDCIAVTVNGSSSVQTTLGITSGIMDFRYEYRELGS
ncbi:hypothetical protein ACTGJ9_036380 [Bradyrhizobium sp. RDM12]